MKPVGLNLSFRRKKTSYRLQKGMIPANFYFIYLLVYQDAVLACKQRSNLKVQMVKVENQLLQA
jgi:hypothetical protein